ncbi:hypothetical protein [Streptomyces sp. DW26H14]|uniref:hypothetical protein n=1 Tax=Streptomyces sp. DW26H14 TaxID=3435395 RepID=UPI00403D913F
MSDVLGIKKRVHGRQLGAEAAGGVGEREVEVLRTLEEPPAPVGVRRGSEIAQVVEAVAEPDEKVLGREPGLSRRERPWAAVRGGGLLSSPAGGW